MQDVDRPDVKGNPPKMARIHEMVRTALVGHCNLGYVNVTCDDNLCSTVWVRGSFDAKETWSNGIIENSRYFLVSLSCANRYYTEGDKVILQFSTGWAVTKLRKYTGTPEKCIEKLLAWIKDNAKTSCQPQRKRAMIRKMRSEVRPGQTFTIQNKDVQDFVCVAIQKEQMETLCPPLGRMMRNAFYHVYCGSGEISWMWDREVWVDEETS